MTTSRQAGLAQADGIWYQYGGPQVICGGGRTFWGSVSLEGDIRVASYDHATGAITDTVIAPVFQPDDHAQPSLLIRSTDNRVIVFYTKHTDAILRWRISDNPYDISKFGPELTYTLEAPGVQLTYPQPVELTSEGRVYVFFRRTTTVLDDREWRFVTSMDDGETLGNESVLRKNFANVGGAYIVNPYTIPCSNGVDMIHFASFDYAQIAKGGIPRNLYHFYYYDGRLFTSNGSYIKDIGDPIEDVAEVTVVHETNHTNIWDITLDAKGHPVIVYTRFEDYVTDHRYRYARWNGSKWSHYEIVSAGGPVATPQGREWYSGGMCLNRRDPSIVYVSRETSHGVFEVFEYVTQGGGATWSPVKKYVGKPNAKNFRPKYPRNADEDCVKLMFIAGDYEDLNDYGPVDIFRVADERPKQHDRVGTRAMRIGIVYGHISSNLGDVAINHGTAAMLRKVAPGAHVHVVLLNLPESRLPEAEAAFSSIESKSFAILRTREKLAADLSSDYTELALATEYVLNPARFIADTGLTGCDVVLYNSGEHLFTSENGRNHINLCWRLLPALAAKAAGMRFVVLPATVGPFESPSLEPMLRAFLTLSDDMAVRETVSAQMAAGFLGVAPPPVLLDPAFFAPVPKQEERGADPTLALVMRIEGFGLRAGTFYESSKHLASFGDKGLTDSLSFRFAVAAARSFVDLVGGRIRLIVQNRVNDGDLASAIADALKAERHGDRLEVEKPRSVSEYQVELGKADFIVASRFHACILGLLSGRPVMGVYFDEHGHKMRGLFDALGISQYSCNLSRTAPEAAAELVVPLFLGRERAFTGMPDRLRARQEDTLRWLAEALAGDSPFRSGEVAGASIEYIRGVEAVCSSAAPDAIPVLYREATRLRADLNTARAELNTARAELTSASKETSRLKSELAKERRKLQQITNSLPYQLGNALLRPVRRPGRFALRLAYRVAARSPNWVKGIILKATSKSKMLTALQTAAGRTVLPTIQWSKVRGGAARKECALRQVMERVTEIRQQMAPVSKHASEPCRKDLNIAAIMDEFTYECFRYEACLITFTPDNWKQLLSGNRPEFLFVESAWRGNDSSWRYQIVNMGQKPRSQLPALVQWCKDQGIPTAFWNKEDPAHYHEFLDAARLFDYVFTTDADCIEAYKKDLAHDRVFCLPFAVQPRIHNPIGSGRKIRNVAFAGSWYVSDSADKMARREQMACILEPALEMDVDIFDRHHGMNSERYRFPAKYQPYIVGEVPYEAMVDVYKVYRIFLNVSSVSNSPTMLPRRVLEILASGTCVMSGHSKGIENLIGSDIVKMSSSAQDTRLYLEELLGDQELRDRLVHAGRRKVLTEHTCERRLDYILQALGIRENIYEEGRKGVSIIACTNKPGFMQNVFANYDRQQYEDKELIIVLNNDDLDIDEWMEEARRHDNVSVYRRGEEQGLGTCLNFGIGKARFEYIAKFDDDDYYAPAYLRDAMLAFDFTNADIVGKHTYYIYLERDSVLAIRFPGREQRFTTFVSGATMVMKRGVFDRVQFDSRKGHGSDTRFQAECLRKGLRIYATDRFNFVLVRKPTTVSHTWKATADELLPASEAVCNTRDYATHVTC